MAGGEFRKQLKTPGGATAWRLVRAAAFGVVIMALCWASITIRRDMGQMLAVWPANAVILSVLLVSPMRRWPLWLAAASIGNEAANLLVGDAPGLSLAFTASNLFEVGFCGLALRRFCGARLDFRGSPTSSVSC